LAPGKIMEEVQTRQVLLTKPLETFVTKRRDRKAVLKLLRKTMKRYGSPNVIVTDKLRSYSAAMKNIGIVEKQETGR
jgi:putative transposase